MPENDKSPLVQALEKKRTKIPETDKLLQMILKQITKLNNHFLAEEDDDEDEVVTTQESHS